MKTYVSRKLSIVALIIFVVLQLLSIFPAIIMRDIIDNIIPHQDVAGLFGGILIFVLIPFSYILVQIIFNYISIVFARKQGNKLSMDILRNLIAQDKTYFDEQDVVELSTFASKEAVQYIYFYVSEYPKYIGYLLVSGVIFVLVLQKSLILALFQLLFIPISMIPVNYIKASLEKNITSVLASNAKISQKRTNLLQGIETVKMLQAEERKVMEIQHHYDDISSKWGKIAALDMISGVWVSGFSHMLFTGLSFALGAFLIMTNRANLSIGELVYLLTLLGLLYSNLSQVINTNISVTKYEAENQKLHSFLELVKKDQQGTELKQIQSLEISNLEFSYPQRSSFILQNISLQAKKGEFIGITGKSGIGKSTLFSLITKFYEAKDGMIKVNDVNLNALSAASIRACIAKVSANDFIFPGTIKENLLLANEHASQDAIWSAIQFAELASFVDALPSGIDTVIGEGAKLLSSGEKQRLSLARAILSGKKVLLLDEVSANVDREAEQVILNNIVLLAKQKDYLIVAISHNQAFLSQCDRVYQITELGSQCEII